ncbi:MAG: preprotein translocase subunit SecG [Deltaproteobacteria bacterium]|nr:preprotein translocase subunit SecG [Deltaproteobacteria bacterium]
MENLILIIHYIVCAVLVVVILLQAGKGADLGAVFGGGSGTVFGSRGAATFLGKLTTAMAIVFMLTSLSLAYYKMSPKASVTESINGKNTQSKQLSEKAKSGEKSDKASGQTKSEEAEKPKSVDKKNQAEENNSPETNAP